MYKTYARRLETTPRPILLVEVLLQPFRIRSNAADVVQLQRHRSDANKLLPDQTQIVVSPASHSAIGPCASSSSTQRQNKKQTQRASRRQHTTFTSPSVPERSRVSHSILALCAGTFVFTNISRKQSSRRLPLEWQKTVGASSNSKSTSRTSKAKPTNSSMTSTSRIHAMKSNMS